MLSAWVNTTVFVRVFQHAPENKSAAAPDRRRGDRLADLHLADEGLSDVYKGPKM